MENNYPTPTNRKVAIIALFLAVVLMFLVTITFLISNYSKTKTTTADNSSGSSSATTSQTGSSSPRSASGSSKSADSVPQVSIKSWAVPNASTASVNNAPIYVLKQNYSADEIKAFAQRLGATDKMKTDGDITLAYSLGPSTDTIALKINSKTGAFSYFNTLGLPLSTDPSKPLENKVYDFLKSINRYDPTIRLTAQYKKTDSPGIIYLELHRDWKQAGLPIVNFNGLVNLPENQPLSSYNVDSKITSLPLDPTIYSTTDGRDGYKRPNDFNTITLTMVEKDQSIIAIDSNLRELMSAQKTQPLITMNEAINRLKNNQYEMIFTSPSGNGDINWNKLYPDNKANADQAIVSDSTYAYLEQLPGQVQAQLKPYVIFRATSLLNSGYNTNVIVAVPAVANTQVTNKSVLGAFTYLAQETTSTQGQGQDMVPNTPHPTETPSPESCKPTSDELSPTYTYTDPATGAQVKLGLGEKWRFDPHANQYVDDNEKAWYYIFPDSLRSASPDQKEARLHDDWQLILSHISSLDPILKTQSNGAAGLYACGNRAHGPECLPRTWDLIKADFIQAGQGTCPINFSGLSPSILIYGKAGQTIDVKPLVHTTYTDPAMTSTGWHVVLGQNNILSVNNTPRSFLYYEHDVKSFTRPQQGWNINRNDLDSFVKTVAQKLQLTVTETERLSFEVTNAAADVTGTSLFVGITDPKEVANKLPIELNPVPESVVRFHMYVGKAEGPVTAPAIQPIVRKKFMVVELGAE